MNTILYFSANGTAYETQAYSKADIDQLVHEHGLQCLTTSDRQFDFWFSPSTRQCQRRVNQRATELLLATGTFTPKTVPLLHGSVVVATHDSAGDLDGLSWEQLDILAAHSGSLSKRAERTLTRRANAADRKLLRGRTAAAPTPVPERTPVEH